MGLRTHYAVDVAVTGADGLMLAESSAYDAILLDIGLPDFTGKEVCNELRHGGNHTPIIILSGSHDIKDKVELLDMGADDYVTKPFRLEEVHARIRAAFRHHKEQSATTLQVADLLLDPASRTVWRAGKPIHLRRKEFDMLEYMMRNSGRTLTRIMILEHIWDMNENLWANVVDVHIKHLRDKVDRPFSCNLIKTEHGLGYRIEAPANWKGIAQDAQ